ncbi:MAG: hypothetical protein JWL85_1028 [Candidatus Saccharibacteria bacterium]|nr:hypothetical protein [Candidatus Saccharibacteria bacterium]
MLQLSNSLIDRPVLSLRTGGHIATTVSAIFNPNNLKIEGFYCSDRFEKRTTVLLTQEIRDIIAQGFVVNDHESLTDPEELVRLKEILAINFELIGKPVYTVSKEKLGKINDYAADSETLYVQKLYVGPSLLKSLSSGQLSIDRTQIVEITNKKIVVQDLMQMTKSALPMTASPMGS